MRVLTFTLGVAAGAALSLGGVAIYAVRVAQPVVQHVAGECLSGSCQDGYGTFRTRDGGTYTGDFADGAFHGSGSYTSAADKHGRRLNYKGEFVRGQMEGEGTMILRNGRTYIGDFANDLPHGRGEIRYSDGRIFRGSIRSGLPDGIGTMSHPGGTEEFGGWRAGRLIARD